jgi:hypothetical protein
MSINKQAQTVGISPFVSFSPQEIGFLPLSMFTHPYLPYLTLVSVSPPRYLIKRVIILPAAGGHD